ncbi:MAG: CerR family C-terminal domain-containing protein [Alphaproteobacteria bacterium]|nr:CerR family C-terminal domain-containing protein [Alphaproteobacteria bacterium]
MSRPAAASVRGPGRPGGDASRGRILDEAGKLFARDGFDAVTIRRIAARAGVNLAAIGYHFGGKKGLYHEVMRQIIIDVAPIIEPVVARMRADIKSARGDRRALSDLAARFVRHTLTTVLMNERLRWQHALLVREFAQPSEEFPMILEEAVNPMHDAVAELVAAATGKPATEPETRLLTTDVVGQCMIYQVARNLVCARMGWTDYTPECVESLIAMITGAVQRTLGLPETAPAPVPPSGGA